MEYEEKNSPNPVGKSDKRIELKVNGRVFPLWVLKNFKKFTLPEIIRGKDEDPCQEKISNELEPYQKFVGQFINYRSPFSDILLFHGLGSGKTATAINVYNVLFNFTPKWNVFVIIPASLKNDPWLKDLDKWLGKSEKGIRMKNIQFVSYDSPFADRDFLEKVKKADSSKPTLYIIDEAHNFIRNVYNNISTKQGKRAQVIYDYIQTEKKENSTRCRVLLLTATPTVNVPFEYALYFNLMRPGSFPESEAIFNQIYISSVNYQSLNDEARNMFQRRILGLTSYYIGSTPDKFAQKTVHYRSIVMEEYQEKIYEHYEEIEEEKEKIRIRMAKGKSKTDDNMSTYSTYTRQSCNFVFPTVGTKINGEDRPRPGKFKIKEEEAAVLDEGKDKVVVTELKKNKENKDYTDAINKYINNFIDYLKELFRKDKEKSNSLKNDVDKFYNKYNQSLSLFLKDEKNKSKLFELLYSCSPKYIHIIFNLLKSKGPVLVYSNYVAMEGLQIFKIYLNFFGFAKFDEDNSKDFKRNKPLEKSKNFFRFMEFHGAIDSTEREENRRIFNNKLNKDGSVIKIILISPAGTEGINLMNTRQVHIMEPFWNEVRVEQIIGRAIRICSHKELPMDERKVDVFRYKMVRSNGKETADEKLESIGRKKSNLLESFTEAVKSSAVDCELFKSHNMMGTKYKCFKFNEDSLFDKPTGPAFTENFEFDNKMDNGIYSLDSVIEKIKVLEIMAVKRLDENSYSEAEKYWFNEETGVVYDYNLDQPIGKVERDDNGNYVKLKGNVYVISILIDVPEFKLFD